MNESIPEGDPEFKELTEVEKKENRKLWENYLQGLAQCGLTSVRGLGFRLPGTVIKLPNGNYGLFRHNPKRDKQGRIL